MDKINLLSSYTFSNGFVVKNRIVMAPMTTMSSFYNGQITEDELKYYQLRAGGPGMLITGVAYITEQGKGFEGQLGASSLQHLSGLTKLAKTIKQNGTKAILQIFHAGRMSNSKVLRGINTVSASDVAALRPDAEKPKALSENEILTIIEDFANATHLAIQAGFDGIELHGANTYLLQQFFSPHSNRRTDQWGGDLSKRMKFPLAVIKKIKTMINTTAKQPFLLGYRLSPEEFETPGIRLQDTLTFVDKLATSGIDYLHTSIGHIWRQPIGEHLDSSPIILQMLNVINNRIPLIGGGSVQTPDEVTNILNKGIPLVALGRELIREPKWVQKVENDDAQSIRYRLSKAEMDELAIPPAMQIYLNESFRDVMDFTTDTSLSTNRYLNQIAPMEGYEKKL
ncbi:2,4-dienoyl-CoA reductase-like NADH-dependent reductase (Old Yellow Enzyme family) [Orbus hercynius]|uniref:2,4-dienoyl-CoA reductase-like NADH-dependent reductase (Old Yellow Enzyme family) n=1 Tax=Orbus hercynius TaxID=593135 RepID=A0A495RIH8_9GAMM|nr:NADH-dependent flavin oxidoreductase [Orbus hercynius]RKS87149.1 2,4-dienoyl-CoA reductase-like NADH-dependent reductase (Old Yellow Enzyme family) [Orbus hercynius]